MRDDDALLLLLLGALAMSGGSPELELRPEGWVWPLPELPEDLAEAWNVKPRPEVSDKMGSPRDGGKRLHVGVDLMYKRRNKASSMIYRGTHGSAWHQVPYGTQALAARAGRIWFAGRTGTGFSVILDHGPLPIATYYTHLASLAIPEVHRTADRNTIVVLPGQPLGEVGWSPLDKAKVAHLHFEIRKGMQRINPEPGIHAWGLVKL
jgi:hypothetical protein